ncbi:hypothetical protein A8B82_21715 [Sulfitobacter sp. EhC04]|nr:hypothetical protein A8B82_21715 [Sulfitobacter sp. EhC04]
MVMTQSEREGARIQFLAAMETTISLQERIRTLLTAVVAMTFCLVGVEMIQSMEVAETTVSLDFKVMMSYGVISVMIPLLEGMVMTF